MEVVAGFFMENKMNQIIKDAAQSALMMRIESDFAAQGLPDRMWGGVSRYLEHGISPGHFLTAVISNNLKECVARADCENMRLLPEYVKFFYNCVPGGCWGSQHSFDVWIESGGFIGQQARAEKESGHEGI